MSNALRLEVRRAEFASRWIFQVLSQDGESLSGDPKETFATRREAMREGEAVLQRVSQQLRHGPITVRISRREA